MYLIQSKITELCRILLILYLKFHGYNFRRVKQSEWERAFAYSSAYNFRCGFKLFHSPGVLWQKALAWHIQAYVRKRYAELPAVSVAG